MGKNKDFDDDFDSEYSEHKDKNDWDGSDDNDDDMNKDDQWNDDDDLGLIDNSYLDDFGMDEEEDDDF